METTIISMLQTSVDWVTMAFEAPFARAVVFGVQIGGHLFVEGLLFVVILYLLSQKSYAPPKKPLTEEDSCTSAVEKYGVGSCGPRGFYGTIGLSVFIISDGCSSRDEGVHWGIQNGLHLSRSKILHFKHNNMESLKRTLETITIENKRKKTRRYIVIEAVYQVEKVDIITAAMGHALAAEGGFCTGNARVIDHQRLSSFGYVFSASLPPYLASTAISAIDVLEENPNLISKLNENVAQLRTGLSNSEGLVVASDPNSPIVFLQLSKSTGSSEKDMQLLEDIVDELLEKHNIFVVTSKLSTLDKCPIPVGIKLFVSAGHGESDIMKVCEALKMVVPSVLNK
uniref:serine C-palmitoyltransferase n=1 Tax=Chenopodium quinoa TaxID=63459 RepID=A0A803M803_CHEQI